MPPKLNKKEIMKIMNNEMKKKITYKIYENNSGWIVRSKSKERRNCKKTTTT